MINPALPPVAVTCGDPSGIGPEIVWRAWQALGGDVPFFLIGDPDHLPKDAPVAVIASPAEVGAVIAGGVPVLTHAFPAPALPGAPDPKNARPIVEVIEKAVELVQSGKASALCTAPISKNELVQHADFKFPGHTEFLAHLSGADRPVMMLASDMLKVVPTTIHIPLADVPHTLTPQLLEETIRVTAQALQQDFGIEAPRIVVAGLNPHAGENGLLGQEDAAVIAPVVQKLASEGFAVTGPLSADTMFHAEARAQYDAAIAMYHDQALIPIKTLAFDTGVNVTLGLPFPRTSPDHGTAYGIAGKDVASAASMEAALRMAWNMAQARHGARQS